MGVHRDHISPSSSQTLQSLFSVFLSCFLSLVYNSHQDSNLNSSQHRILLKEQDQQKSKLLQFNSVQLNSPTMDFFFPNSTLIAAWQVAGFKGLCSIYDLLIWCWKHRCTTKQSWKLHPNQRISVSGRQLSTQDKEKFLSVWSWPCLKLTPSWDNEQPVPGCRNWTDNLVCR